MYSFQTQSQTTSFLHVCVCLCVCVCVCGGGGGASVLLVFLWSPVSTKHSAANLNKFSNQTELIWLPSTPPTSPPPLATLTLIRLPDSLPKPTTCSHYAGTKDILDPPFIFLSPPPPPPPPPPHTPCSFLQTPWTWVSHCGLNVLLWISINWLIWLVDWLTAWLLLPARLPILALLLIDGQWQTPTAKDHWSASSPSLGPLPGETLYSCQI